MYGRKAEIYGGSANILLRVLWIMTQREGLPQSGVNGKRAKREALVSGGYTCSTHDSPYRKPLFWV